MMISPYRLSETRLLVWLTLPVFSLPIFQPTPETTIARVGPSAPVAQRPAGSGQLKSFSSRQSRNLIVSGRRDIGQGVQIPLGGKAKSKAQIIAETIAKTGPALGEAIIMSGFSISGFAKEGWPLVICYELEEQSTAQLLITRDGKQSVAIELKPTNGRPAEIIRQLRRSSERNHRSPCSPFMPLRLARPAKECLRISSYAGWVWAPVQSDQWSSIGSSANPTASARD